MEVLQRLVDLLDQDPFSYFLLTMFGIIVWTWCSVIGDYALTGRGIWVRWLSLFLAGLGAVLFALTARQLA